MAEILDKLSSDAALNCASENSEYGLILSHSHSSSNVFSDGGDGMESFEVPPKTLEAYLYEPFCQWLNLQIGPLSPSEASMEVSDDSLDNESFLNIDW